MVRETDLGLTDFVTMDDRPESKPRSLPSHLARQDDQSRVIFGQEAASVVL
jgi:hypothetical protein